MNTENLAYSQLAKGSLLIASPEIENGIFFRSVLVICEHNQSGSLALIINKEIDFEVGDQVIEVEDLANPNVELRAGGPIQMNQMLVLHTQKKDLCKELSPGVFLGGDLDFLQDSLLDPEGPPIRLMFGYTSWAAGQLEKEFMSGEWFIRPGDHRLVFETEPEDIWRTSLAEMGGKFSSLARMPDDLSLN